MFTPLHFGVVLAGLDSLGLFYLEFQLFSRQPHLVLLLLLLDLVFLHQPVYPVLLSVFRKRGPGIREFALHLEWLLILQLSHASLIGFVRGMFILLQFLQQLFLNLVRFVDIQVIDLTDLFLQA